jgi:hypothetical protein
MCDLFLGIFDGRPGDYFFMLLFNWACAVIVGLIAETPVSVTSYCNIFTIVMGYILCNECSFQLC